MSATFVCGHCGASLDIPEDDAAVDARCEFCSRHTRLPKDILELRARRAARTSSRPAPHAMLATFGAMVALGAIGAGAFFFSSSASHSPPAPVSRPIPSLPVTPTAEPTPATTPIPDGAEQASGTLQTLYASGCKTVILPPTQSSGEQTVETKLVMNGTCVTVIAVSGHHDNELLLTMKTPLGVLLPTPARAPELSFSVCPKMPGTYPTTITPSDKTPYTVAAVECPAAKKASR